MLRYVFHIREVGMSLVITDESMVGQLAATRTTMELRTPDGRLLGHFIPVLEDSARGPNISEEELTRRERMGGGRPLKKILADLEKKA
jgi:hypothetical protein